MHNKKNTVKALAPLILIGGIPLAGLGYYPKERAHILYSEENSIRQVLLLVSRPQDYCFCKSVLANYTQVRTVDRITVSLCSLTSISSLQNDLFFIDKTDLKSLINLRNRELFKGWLLAS